ncbi:MAG: FAD/NAD(P)-binding protein [Brachybacterium tyrofermentans]|uniref:FAD/NAD(P)-binding protein n=1 Tax=Brachybacterium tyrofermentans TaxID=47848 RepID=UPI003FB920FF
MAERAATGPLRLAVIGAGPKALFALEELAALLVGHPEPIGRPGAGSPRELLEITVLDPGEHPGTGAAYDLSQPPELLLNVGSGILDAPAAGAFASFPDWAAREHPELAEEPYPPRAVVGRYLTERWQRMQESLAPFGTVRLLRDRAVAVHRDADGWLVSRGEGSAPLAPADAAETPAAPAGEIPADEVLVATGHAAGHDSSLATARASGRWSAGLPLRPAVLPVGTMLAAAHVPPGSRVAVRGGALTFIDAALTLTVGRGARFHPDSAGSGRLLHERSPEEPSAILPTTRHGLLLEAKPDPGTALPDAAEAAIEEGRRQLAYETSLSGSLTPDQVLEIVLGVAARLLDDVDSDVDVDVDTGSAPALAVRRTLGEGSDPELPSGPGRAAEALRRSVAVAEGSRKPGPSWALGRAWVLMYPQITAALRDCTVDETAWSRFREAELVLDRFAFGPPLDTARELLAMVDSGAVDLSWVDAGTTITAQGIQGLPAGSASADVVVDAVQPPPGLVGVSDPLARHLLETGLVSVRPGRRGAVIDPDATAIAPDGSRVEGLALLGRPTEDHVIGHDTLNRHLHAEPGLWARRLGARLLGARRPSPRRPSLQRPDVPDVPDDADLRSGCQGLPPLTARLEPWMRELLADPVACRDLLEDHGSPLNVHDFSALPRNASELSDAAAEQGVDLRIFVARKANKTLGLMTAAQNAGLGLDMGSERELEQALELGVPAQDIVVTAAIKPAPLLRLALTSGAMLVLDNLDEAAAVDALLASPSSVPAPTRRPVALRLAPTPSETVGPTRFGESARTWREWAQSRDPVQGALRLDGIHFHLHGYDPLARAHALAEAVGLVDALRALGHRPRFIDIGGGIPMSYLDDPEEWATFWSAHEDRTGTADSSLTWRGEPLRQVYPYHQDVVRGQWLTTFLAAEVDPGTTAADALRERGLELRCEPGRSMLDGCGMTLARVVQRTSTSDGIPLVGLEMNRTQCRSTSDDFLVDPVLVRAGAVPPQSTSEPVDAFLVGAYCIEAELIQRRRLRFPHGVHRGDIVALPNTAGYLMHILESASHQIPLASNMVQGPDGWRRDRIDAVSPLRPWADPAS